MPLTDRRVLEVTSQAGCLKLRPDPMSWARFDFRGRWRAALLGGVTYRRALCGDVLAITRDSIGEDRLHDVTEVSAAQARQVSEEVVGWARRGGVTALGVVGLDEDAAEFARTYVGKPIVPADMARALLLQATIGCAYNRCSFCTFYRDTTFRMRSAPEFSQHVQAVRRFLGPDDVAATRGLFLGDASGLLMPFSRLTATLATIREQFPATRFSDRLPQHPWHAPPNAVSCFCDAFVTPPHSVDELHELARLGLHRVYVGVESGSDRLLQFLQKPATASAALRLVERLKGAGLRVSVIVMVGAGGRSFAAEHLRETADLISRMRLDEADALVLSEFFAPPGYAQEIQPMTRVECRQQMRQLIRLVGPAPKVQMYDSRQLVY